MNSRIILLILICTCSNIFSQEKGDTLFYSSDWKITSREQASYFRLGHFDIPNRCFSGDVYDYTMDNELLMHGNYKNGLRNGRFALIDKNKDSLDLYFVNGDISNSCKVYNSQKKLVKEYFYVEEFEYIVNFSGKKKNALVVNGKGYFNEERIYRPLQLPYSIEGPVRDSVKTGKWLIRNSKNQVLLTEKYKNGVLLRSDPNILNNEYDIEFLTREFFIFEIPEKLASTEALLIETGVPIRENNILIALKEMNDEMRGIQKHSRTLRGYLGLQLFLDEKILFNSVEIFNYPEDDTIVIQYIHNPDFTLEDISLFKPSYSDALNTEILQIMNAIEKLELEKTITKPKQIKYTYRLKFPLTEMATPLPDN